MGVPNIRVYEETTLASANELEAKKQHFEEQVRGCLCVLMATDIVPSAALQGVSVVESGGASMSFLAICPAVTLLRQGVHPRSSRVVLSAFPALLCFAAGSAVGQHHFVHRG